MGKLNMISGYIRTVADCLPGIRSDIVRNYNRWQAWEFTQFVTAPEKWTQRDSISNNEIKKRVGHDGKEKMLNTKQHEKKCVYCKDRDHNSTYYKKVESVAERKQNTDGKKVMRQLH